MSSASPGASAPTSGAAAPWLGRGQCGQDAIAERRTFGFHFFPRYLFQDVVNSAQITATVTCGGSYAALGVPRDGLAEWFHKKRSIINAARKMRILLQTAPANSLSLQRNSPETSANTRLGGEMDFIAKTLVDASQPHKQTCGEFQLLSRPRRALPPLPHTASLCTNLSPNDWLL